MMYLFSNKLECCSCHQPFVTVGEIMNENKEVFLINT